MKNHLSITGSLGSGKSTVCRLIADKYGYEIYSTGKIQRELAASMGISTLELNNLSMKDKTLDNKIDSTTTSISIDRKDDKLLFDSRMAWNFAVDSYKVFLYVDPYISASRVYSDQQRGDVETYSSVEDALKQLIERATLENIRFKTIYNVDNFDYRNYDLVTDSSFMNQQEVSEFVYSCYSQNQSGVYMFSPCALYPTLPFECPDESDRITVTRVNGYHYVINGHKKLVNAIRNGEKLVRVDIEPASDLDISGVDLKKYENNCGFRYPSIPEIYRQ